MVASANLTADAFDFMPRHCGESLSRADAAAAHLTPSRFSHLTREESGSPFTERLNRLRIGRAAALPRDSAKPLSLVARECGFEDQSYFTKGFKRYRNAPPGEFRRRSDPGQ